MLKRVRTPPPSAKADVGDSVGGPMYTWCENDIQNTNAEWIIAFWHHPPYSKGSHDSDAESSLSSMRENIIPMLEDNGVDLILSGHSHSYERSYCRPSLSSVFKTSK